MNESIYLRQRQPPRRRIFLLIFAALAVIFFSSRTVLSYYVDSLWFGSLGYAEVFRKTISLQWLVFAVCFGKPYIPCGRALLYAEPIYLQAERSPMPELRLVVLALQDKLAYGPTFESAMRSLFGGEASSLSAVAQPAEAGRSSTSPVPTPAKPGTDMNALISEAAKDLADYQRLTAEGQLGEAGQKLEELKRKLDQLNSRQK